ncbi:MAG: acyltransferase family protein [Solobacterium sp.]|nr:acyltransferase family protein [Solobacterium sp.]
MEYKKRKRTAWIDAAKGLAIVLVIIGHTVPSGSFAHNIIFSFHIPLFFILSGYTLKPASSWADFFYSMKRDAAHLLIPYVLSGLVIALVRIFYRHLIPLEVMKNTLQALVWASGTGDGVHEPIGALWFLVSLFTAKQIVNGLFTAYKNDVEQRAPYVIAIVSVLGFGIGMFDWNWLIFNFDVSMAASGYVLAGYLLNRHLDSLKKYDRLIIPVFLIIWMYLMKAFGYIEMSGRWYPELSLGVLESFCASYCVIRFVQAMCFFAGVKNVLCWIGRNSLWLMCIHAVEDSLFQFWERLPVFPAVCLRVLVNLILMATAVKGMELLKGQNTGAEYE